MRGETHVAVLHLGKGKVAAYLPVGSHHTACCGVALFAPIIHIHEEECASELVCLEHLHSSGDRLTAVFAVGISGLAEVIMQLDIHLGEGCNSHHLRQYAQEQFSHFDRGLR